MLSTESKYDFVTSIEKTHGRQLRRYLAARLRNAATDLPDLMQEVYLRLLRIEDFDTVRKPLAYLSMKASWIAMNVQTLEALFRDDIDVHRTRPARQLCR